MLFRYPLFSWGSSFKAVPIPTRIASCLDRSLSSAPSDDNQRDKGGTTHKCVISILSSQLRANCLPPFPPIFASSDCANVKVTWTSGTEIFSKFRASSKRDKIASSVIAMHRTMFDDETMIVKG